MKLFDPHEAMAHAARRLGWTAEDQLAAVLDFIADNTGLRPRDFAAFLQARLTVADNQDAEPSLFGPVPAGRFLLRSDAYADGATGEPLYRSRLVGWIWWPRATVFSAAELERIAVPRQGVTRVPADRQGRPRPDAETENGEARAGG